MGTKNQPGKFDCYEKAEPDEPMFVLLGRDPCAPILIEFWVDLRKHMGEDQEKLAEAVDCAAHCYEWLAKKGKALAYVDLIDECEEGILPLLKQQSEQRQIRLKQLEELIKQLVIALDVESSGSGHGELKRVATDLLEGT
jgi:hypothetical protein